MYSFFFKSVNMRTFLLFDWSTRLGAFKIQNTIILFLFSFLLYYWIRNKTSDEKDDNILQQKMRKNYKLLKKQRKQKIYKKCKIIDNEGMLSKESHPYH